MWRPFGGPSRLTWRRLRVLVDHLPRESATKTVLRDSLTAEEWEALPRAEGWGAWSDTDLILGEIADRLAWVQWAIVRVNSEKEPKHPAPLPRPGVGLPPHVVAERLREENRERIAFLKALEDNDGARPSPEQVEAKRREIAAALGEDWTVHTEGR